jgi:hypothetical protein
MSKGKEEIFAAVTSGQSPPHAISTPIINLLSRGSKWENRKRLG